MHTLFIQTLKTLYYILSYEMQIPIPYYEDIRLIYTWIKGKS